MDEELIPRLGEAALALLKRDGAWMCALSVREIMPYTVAQARFLAVAHQILPAQSRQEMAWMCYLNLLRVARNVERSHAPMRSAVSEESGVFIARVRPKAARPRLSRSVCVALLLIKAGKEAQRHGCCLYCPHFQFAFLHFVRLVHSLQ